MFEWARLRTLSGLGEYTAQWLEGTRARYPGHQGRPDAETTPLVPALARLNRAGVVTLTSQPGYHGVDGQQRASVSALAEPDRAEQVAVAAQSAGLWSWTWVTPRWQTASPGAVPITTDAEGRVVTDDGRRLSRRDVDMALGTSVPSRCYATARQLVVIDPVWGRTDHLWHVLATATAPPDTHSSTAPPATSRVSQERSSTVSSIDEIRQQLALVTEKAGFIRAALHQTALDIEEIQNLLAQAASGSSHPAPQQAQGTFAQLASQIDEHQGLVTHATDTVDEYAASL